jgi:hypothetical protein
MLRYEAHQGGQLMRFLTSADPAITSFFGNYLSESLSPAMLLSQGLEDQKTGH